MLSEAVKSARADFGVAYDGDRGRSIFCVNTGTIYMGDKTGALLVKHLLSKKHKGSQGIVCPISTSMILSVVAEQAGSSNNLTDRLEVSKYLEKW